MPIVELVAQKIIERNPDIDLEITDLIVLLWMFSSPYENNRRQLSSMKNILRMSQSLQNPMGKLDLTDDELTQLVLSSLEKLKKRKLVYIRSSGHIFVKGTLTEKGSELIMQSVRTPLLRRLTAEFGDNP
ncbi:MAG: hypothetical protein BAJATHORv1_50003 [Candidatus Thorarchaeota archaeon]|nr:MAG: hypothetical protein BAJATHORv1_50003 [Candidatus Thorarchaeota archaeon]